jgi:hypothetical protein
MNIRPTDFCFYGFLTAPQPYQATGTTLATL